MNVKGIELAWLSLTSLTNLNSGEGESNLIDVKKYRWYNKEYPYVSGQAMRFYLKEAIRRLHDYEGSCIPNDKGETCGDVAQCELCDLFGYMTTIAKSAQKAGGARIRVSPVKVAPAVGLLPFDDNSTIDFLTRKKRSSVDSGDLKGDIVNVEMGMNIYRSGISIDAVRVGREESIIEGEKRRTMELKDLIDEDMRRNRIDDVLAAVLNIADYSKQARLLTDFTPELLIGSVQPVYNHKLQKAIDMDEQANVNINRLSEVIAELRGQGDQVYLGLLSGAVNNADEVRSFAEEAGIYVGAPSAVITSIKSMLE